MSSAWWPCTVSLVWATFWAPVLVTSQILPVPSLFKSKKDSSGLRTENGRGNSILQGCVLCVLTMQKATEAPGLVFPGGRAQGVTHPQCSIRSLAVCVPGAL